ncbi:hypothetical protein PsorP6_013511 [Peronosclerospora sorghi]|uniref:Uncharacterized protein n=1 Tax=Peronosclerospora sorghi TaxID=230839 RepID=A0ACC0VH41_9STRA|nr:hypothetical protein PsorP6_013511 [Peronosclerospora sorghi]
MKPLVKKVSKHALDKFLAQYNNSIDMDDGDAFTGLFRSSFGVPCRHEIKRRIKENGRFHIGDIHRQWHLVAPPVVQPVAVAAEPCSSPRNSLMRTIEQRLYEADDDHVPVVMERLDEASQAPLQSLSNTVVVTRKCGRPAGSTNNKAKGKIHSLSTLLVASAPDVASLVTMLVNAMCKSISNTYFSVFYWTFLLN